MRLRDSDQPKRKRKQKINAKTKVHMIFWKRHNSELRCTYQHKHALNAKCGKTSTNNSPNQKRKKKYIYVKECLFAQNIRKQRQMLKTLPTLELYSNRLLRIHKNEKKEKK